MVKLFLEAEKFEVSSALNGDQGVAAIAVGQPDLILLDFSLPDTDGIALCRKIRDIYDRPILFLTGNKLQADKLSALQAGGDDYIVKPFDPLELVARVKSHLRWSKLVTLPKESCTKLSFPGLEIDCDRQTVTAHGQNVVLLAKEMQLLLTLAQNPQRVYHPQQLYELIWHETTDYTSDIIKAHIHNLRKKIETDPKNPFFVHTVKGFGYKFDPKVTV